MPSAAVPSSPQVGPLLPLIWLGNARATTKKTCEPGRLSFLSAFSHMECEVVSRLSPSQTVTPLSPDRGGARAGAAGVRDICGPESDVRVSALRFIREKRI